MLNDDKKNKKKGTDKKNRLRNYVFTVVHDFTCVYILCWYIVVLAILPSQMTRCHRDEGIWGGHFETERHNSNLNEMLECEVKRLHF